MGIGAVFVTCWRSLVLKNVAPEHLPEWRMLLGRHGVRVRHVDAALHWQVCERLPEARELAATVIARLSRRSIVTSGLSFVVTDDPTRHEVTVAIQPLIDERLPFARRRRRYVVRHREGFDRHNPGWLTFARRLRERDLAASLATLTRRFYGDGGEPPTATAEPPEPPLDERPATWSCAACGNEYDPVYGDPLGKVAPGTAFPALPTGWRCPVCDAPPADYQPLPRATAPQPTANR